MQVRLVFLGRLAEQAGTSSREVAGASALEQVYRQLDPALVEALAGPRIRVAVNGALVADPAALTLADGDEIAFLPPVSGG